MPAVIEAEENMMSTTETPVEHQKIDMALIGKGGPLETHLVVKKERGTTKEREVDTTDLREHLVYPTFNFTVFNAFKYVISID